MQQAIEELISPRSCSFVDSIAATYRELKKGEEPDKDPHGHADEDGDAYL